MRTSQDLIVEDIRRYLDAKAQEYGYSVKAAVADFEKAHKLLMQSRGLTRPALRARAARNLPLEPSSKSPANRLSKRKKTSSRQ